MSIDDRSLHFSGNRTGVLLIHGLGGTPIEMRFIAVGLARAGYTVSCPQLAGHCGSADDLRATRWQDWYASVLAAHEKLRQHCDVIVAGGLSMGAVMALRLAADRPDSVHGAVLYAPTLRLDGWSIPWYARLFRLVQQRWVADLFDFTERDPYGIKDPRVRGLVTAALESGDSSQAGQLSTPGSSMLEMRRLVNSVLCSLKSIRQPVLLMHPREDDIASLRNTFHLQKHLGGPVQVTVLDDSYHIITLDRQRDLVLERTLRFVADVRRHVEEMAAEPMRSAEISSFRGGNPLPAV
ncbi:MAG: alpha/beta fold hydrolase [Pseudomonadota bacterium]|mgnify:FL=1|jgi:carboxylesterase|nr:MAG: alpha/beta hydrolase [Pseudomonadota bacterium]